MGGCLTVNISCDQVVNQVSKCISTRRSYIHKLSENVESLEQAMEALKAKRDDVQGRVNREEFNGHRQRLSQVQVWLTSIPTIEQQISDLLTISKRELQRLCLCGFCSKNIRLRYRYGKKVIMMLKEVESLSSQGEFDVVTRATGIAEVDELPIQPTIVGHETMITKVWNRLMEEKVGIVGLYGMGGVGKTTLLTQINNEFSKRGGEFDLVIWVVVSNNAKVHKIQESIAKKLDLEGKKWDEKDENERALDIHNVLKRKKFVLFLDDIWEKVSLNVVGVPNPNIENGCKVAFTTRSRDVCGRMGVIDPIEVSCLNPDKAWELFRKKVGENTLGSHPDIPELAKEVAQKCKGLPLALNVIGETMACKSTVQEWHKAIHDLKTSASKFSGMVDEILPILKYSYDNLKGKQMKSCFLYCSLFPEDYLLYKESLIERWIGEGFIDENEGRELGLNQGYEILGTLVRACLLFEEDEDHLVRMHDVVREMAIWIASDLEECKERYIVQAGIGLREVPKMKNQKNVRKISLMDNKIEKLSESLDCPELTTLFLQDNKELLTVSGEFFQSMPKLLVLDLSNNSNLIGLPEQISNLVFLRYLNLSETNIERLPVELHKLKMLIHLDLDQTRNLESLHGISNLSSLRTLRLRRSGVFLDVSLMKELELLEHLEVLSANMSPSLIGELLNYPRVRRCIQLFDIMERSEESVRIIILPVLDNLRRFSIFNCGMWEIKIEKTPWNKTPSDLCFSNLADVYIGMCNDVKDLTWMLFAPNLVRIWLQYLKKLEEIISKEKAASFVEDKTCNILPFQKLQVLDLDELPELKSIYWKALPFQRLKTLKIKGDCQKLRKLPLDSQSVNNVEEFLIEYKREEWVKGIEWEDEATRQRFLPSCKRKE